MTNTVRGVIHGKTIELVDDPGIEDGRGVEVTIRAVVNEAAQVEAILRTAGSMADDPEFDAIMAKIQQERHSDRPGNLAG